MKKLFLVAVASVAILGLTSCEPEDQSEQTYEINAIDKDKVVPPGEKGS